MEFANKFDYKLNYSTIVTNTKSEYKVENIIKKIISI